MLKLLLNVVGNIKYDVICSWFSACESTHAKICYRRSLSINLLLLFLLLQVILVTHSLFPCVACTECWRKRWLGGNRRSSDRSELWRGRIEWYGDACIQMHESLATEATINVWNSAGSFTNPQAKAEQEPYTNNVYGHGFRNEPARISDIERAATQRRIVWQYGSPYRSADEPLVLSCLLYAHTAYCKSKGKKRLIYTV